MKRARTILAGLAIFLLAVGFTGCDALEDINPFHKEKEVEGTVEAIGASSLTVDGIAYTVTGDTEYEGLTGLADLSVGDEVEIEYEDRDGGREAVEVELAGAEDDD
jgi:hypothetical protein